MKLKGILVCSVHEMVESKILRAVRRGHGKLTAREIMRANFSLFRDLSLVECHGGHSVKCSGGNRSPGKLANNQGSPPPSSREMDPNKEEVRQKCQEACMEKLAPGQTQSLNGSLQRVEVRTGNLGGIQTNCLSSQ